ncbi:MAG: PAS domain S-box protein, partial [Desulfobacteraceae bacterium]|nr:PAS domain S-box protein [Desulfobacteraceae bacterium]
QQALTSLSLELIERKKAEYSLKQFRVLLTNIINSMPSILIGVDRQCTITQWNMEASLLTGVSKKNAEGKNVFWVFPALEPFKNEIEMVITQNEVLKKPRTPFEFDNHEQIMDVTVYPLVHEMVDGAVIRIDDISDRIRLEEMMIQSEKMLSIGGLAAGMAHEINNPLAGMMQNAQVISNRLSKNLPVNEKAASTVGTSLDVITAYAQKRGILNQLNNIHKSGHRAAEIIKNMLSFARKGGTAKQKHSLKDLVDQTLDFAKTDYDFKKKFDFNQIKIIREYDSDLPPVWCERGKIQQVLFNIVKNAYQAMNSAEVKLEGPYLIFRLSKGCDSQVCLEIEDNGPGIKKEIRKRIFEPFFT